MELFGARLNGIKGSRDDILRTVELMAEIEKIKLRSEFGKKNKPS
jgi:threonine synthase